MREWRAPAPADILVSELLGSFGAIKSFDLVKDRETQQSKG